MRRGPILLVAACAAASVWAAAAQAAPPTLGADGETAPVYSYADAIRERVWVQVPGVDQDGNGVDDRVALEIMRPLETETAGLDVPAIIDPSPYYTSVGRDGQYVHTSNGVADLFPLFYDNYFVPRGYAVILAEANGTAWSTGCPLHGGPGDIASMKAVIDWLQGSASGFDAAVDGNPVVADWDNGKAAMIGKSYDGTLTNGVAATGVDGLTTIVPISGISSWYDYSRSNGVRFNTDYPTFLSDAIAENTTASRLGDVPPGPTAACTQKIQDLRNLDGDETGDVTPFWEDRDYRPNVGNVRASVFVSFGLNDDNVKTSQLASWWAGLAAHDVPRKLWLSQEGHVDPFDYNRAAWVDTLHRWFDYWLYDVQNGIMLEPRVKLERSTDQFVDEADWPSATAANVAVFLRGTAAGAGTFGSTASAVPTDSRTFTDADIGVSSRAESFFIDDPEGSQANRLAFLSPPLRQDLRISGEPIIDLTAAFNKVEGNLGAILVDYSDTPFTRPNLSNDGVTDSGGTTNCWGDSLGGDTGCFIEPVKPTQSVSSWRVSKGIMDAKNRDSLETETPLVANTSYRFIFSMLANDYVFAAGHRVGVVIISNYGKFPEIRNRTAPTAMVTVNTSASSIDLPIVGGSVAAHSAGLFDYDTTAPTLSLPAPITVEATGPATPVTYAVGATDDEDANPTVSCDHASGTTFGVGQTTVHCDARDASGNTSSGSFTVTVADTTPPSLVAQTVGATEAASALGATVTYTATGSDLADPSPAVSCTPASGSVFPIGTTLVHCDVLDASGNHATGTFTVTVADRTGPALHLPSPAAEATSPAGAAVAYTVTADDLVDPAPVVDCDVPTGSTFPLGDTTVTCTGRDADNNETTASFTVHVVDTSAPTLDASNKTVEATSAAGAAVAFTAGAIDAVDPGATASCVPASGSTFPLGDTTVHCTTHDISGNDGTGSFTVTVRDTTAPELHLPASFEIPARVTPTVVVTYDATAADLVDPSPVVSCLPPSGSTLPIGDTTVACTAADAHGNTSTGSFVVDVSNRLPLPTPPVVVTDSTAPALQLPASVFAAATSRSGAGVVYSVSATDDVDSAPLVSCLPASGSRFGLGTTTVQCTATDRTGNVARGAFTVTVADRSRPTLRLPKDLTVVTTAPDGTRVAFRVRASDAIDPRPDVSCRPASGSRFAVGRTIVHCTARDAAGNTDAGSFTIAVRIDLRRALNRATAAGRTGKRARACALLRAAKKTAKTKAARAQVARLQRRLDC